MSAPATDLANPLQLLAAFEEAVDARQSARALSLAGTLARGLCARWMNQDLALEGYTGHRYPVNAAFCQRFSAAWASLLLADDFDIRAVDSRALLGNLQMIHLLVQGAPEGTLDAAIRLLNKRVAGNHTALTLARLLLMWVPGSRLGLDIFSFQPHAPQLVAAQAVATLASPVAFTPLAHAARSAAIGALNSGRITPADYRPMGISGDLLSASMRCAYAPEPQAHEIKRFLNAVVDAATPPAPPPAPAASDGKPVMIVPLDAFTSAHAMYRCYGPVLEACRAHFRLVALSQGEALDDTAARLFDVIHDIDRECVSSGALDHGRVMQLAMSHRPAIAFYPSVGMSILTLVLALRRIAPVQVMTYGHPDTTFSPVMDHGILEEPWIVDRARYAEQIIPVPHGTLRYTLPPADAATQARRSAYEDTVRIAVPSVSPKWTLPFVEALQQVAARTGRRAEFHFFSGMSSTAYAAARNGVERMFGNAVVHPTLPYEDYRHALARCHVHAGTFPFGGTNSIIDSLLAGIPVVCMRPVDARGAQDADFISRAGLPAWLIADDIGGYVDTLVRLVDDRALLASLHERLADRSRTRDIFLAEGHPEHYARVLRDLVHRPPP